MNNHFYSKFGSKEKKTALQNNSDQHLVGVDVNMGLKVLSAEMGHSIKTYPPIHLTHRDTRLITAASRHQSEGYRRDTQKDNK